ncbi:hypothetical protein [Thioclava electrotropha]|uniref:Uncharacterized protein n=1 Tax=Thioclava electrotropha TaxID=1549850 RepID=A0ABX6YYV6_9RHOB|nr:hypothetical protein [Thioclava electrotropha]QPZ92459.1 hypothetical protein AKL02_017230 [Thioclava electrotropha]
MIRPEVAEGFKRWGEVIAAGVVVAFGAWLIWLGGLILMPLGLVAVALGLGWALIGWRRLRFARETSAPGLVEIDEGRISYFAASRARAIAGPGSNVSALGMGGELPLRELAEIRLLTLQGQQYWRLRSLSGEALLIPLDAAGADALYDAFASLPGIDMGKISAALDQQTAAQSLWTRKQVSRLT